MSRRRRRRRSSTPDGGTPDLSNDIAEHDSQRLITPAAHTRRNMPTTPEGSHRGSINASRLPEGEQSARIDLLVRLVGAEGFERELLPWGLKGVDLGEDVLEIGPGFGATTRVLAHQPGTLTALELSERYCRRLRHSVGQDVEVVQADVTAMPFADGRFSAVVCFTMLHHVPSAALQAQLMTEVCRVLRPGGVFAGTDSRGTGRILSSGTSATRSCPCRRTSCRRASNRPG
jgi:SAM-dependent methyltransferase